MYERSMWSLYGNTRGRGPRGKAIFLAAPYATNTTLWLIQAQLTLAVRNKHLGQKIVELVWVELLHLT